MHPKMTFLAVLATLAIAACGSPAPKPAAKGPAPVGIFTSAQDCAAETKPELKIELKVCDELIQKAIAQHQATAKSYISRRLCEETEGNDRCERTDGNAFRPKLLAFLVTFSTPPTAIPLYAPADRTLVGFTTIDKGKTLLAVDETLTFSADAKVVAEGSVGG
jgi:Protein of unknown function (DUF1190)